MPIYEHAVSPLIMEKVLDADFAEMINGDSADIDEFFKNYCSFFKKMTYDTVSFEICITEILPNGGALMGGKGPIQTREDFEQYPWESLFDLYWDFADKKFCSLSRNIPEGMKAVGGIGNGVFEISQDLVGMEYLAYMQVDNPQLFNDLFVKIGDMMHKIWIRFLERHSDSYAVCRFGDDLGFRSGTLVSPQVINNNIIPQYEMIIDLIKSYEKPFLLHSCGNIFEVMDDLISLKINAKHSNEDSIAPFEKWIDLYGDKIGLFGGIDIDLLCTKSAAAIKQTVKEKGKEFRSKANGYALGSGNSIPSYVPLEGYLAMIEGANEIR
ncbi:uroporphyrinogen decarboxylase family protein [Sedimentisphaera salicampi]|nr:uroporphyrinogen decarboxylase family protein [Sedimentisphaera salicampi]